jgi:hypothetical protein
LTIFQLSPVDKTWSQVLIFCSSFSLRLSNNWCYLFLIDLTDLVPPLFYLITGTGLVSKTVFFRTSDDCLCPLQYTVIRIF